MNRIEFESGRHENIAQPVPMFASSWLALYSLLRYGVAQQHRNHLQRKARRTGRNNDILN